MKSLLSYFASPLLSRRTISLLLFVVATWVLMQITFHGLLKTRWAWLGNASFHKWESNFFQYPTDHGLGPHFISTTIFMVLLPSLLSWFALRSLPPLRISVAYWRDYALLLLLMLSELVLFFALGRDATYARWTYALLIAVPPLVLLAGMHHVPCPQTQPVGIPAVWFYLLLVLSWLLVIFSKSPIVAGFLFNFLFIGFAEEYAYRGVFQPVLQRALGDRAWYGITLANLSTAALFALMHNPTLAPEKMPWLLYTFTGGLAFGLIRDRTGSWFASGLAHSMLGFAFLAAALLRS